MSNSVMVWFAVAVLLFWAMGAYNRLVRLRSQGIHAFAALEGLFNQHVLIVKTNCPQADELRSIHDSDQDQKISVEAWNGLAAAAEQFNASLKVAHVQPLNGPAMSALVTALATLNLSWVRLRDLSFNVTEPELPNHFLLQWDQLALQVDIARSEFNRRVDNYNEAIHQFPALLLAWVFGFKSAQPI